MEESRVAKLQLMQTVRLNSIRESIKEAIDWYSAGPFMLADAMNSIVERAHSDAKKTLQELGEFSKGPMTFEEEFAFIAFSQMLEAEVKEYGKLVVSLQGFKEAVEHISEESKVLATLKMVEVMKTLADMA